MRDPAVAGTPPAGKTPRRRSRRAFLGEILSFAAGLAALPPLLERTGWVEDALAADADLVVDTLNGLVAFVVPGTDEYSEAQGATTEEPGGIDAGATPALIFGLNSVQEFQPTLAASVAAVLNGVAQRVDPDAAVGPFPSPFANLDFADKAAVFEVLEEDPSFAPLRSLAGILPALVGVLAYSEVGVFDPAARALTGRPVGWTLSRYEGVADGRDEFRGYFENRRKADA
jgi:hypothetical protein